MDAPSIRHGRSALSVMRRRYTLDIPGATLELGERTLVMGIVNVTPDSFADGGLRLDPARAIEGALAMVEAGADLVDVGAESTRPGARPLAEEDELARLLPVVEGLAGRLRVPLSVDTYKAPVADAALARGASLVNDISGLRFDPALAGVVARRRAGLVLMHHRGRSADMYEHARYEDVAGEVAQELRACVATAVAGGVPRDRLLIDPGLGFAKRAADSYEALAGLDRLAALDLPIVVGPSRKSFVGEPLGGVPPAARGWGTAAAVAAAVLLGAHVVRVHDVAEMADVVRVTDRVRAALEARRPVPGAELG